MNKHCIPWKWKMPKNKFTLKKLKEYLAYSMKDINN